MSATRKDIGLNVRQWIERAQEDLRLSEHAMTMSTAIPPIASWHIMRSNAVKGFPEALYCHIPYLLQLNILPSS